MIYTLALVVFCSSIAVFFSDELSALLKKISKFPGVKLLIPLLFASWLIEKYQDWGRWLLIQVQALSFKLVETSSHIVSFQAGAVSFFRVLYLFVLAGLPVWFFWLMAKYKGNTKKEPRPLAYRVAVVLWLVAAFLLISGLQ